MEGITKYLPSGMPKLLKAVLYDFINDKITKGDFNLTIANWIMEECFDTLRVRPYPIIQEEIEDYQKLDTRKRRKLKEVSREVVDYYYQTEKVNAMNISDKDTLLFLFETFKKANDFGNLVKVEKRLRDFVKVGLHLTPIEFPDEMPEL